MNIRKRITLSLIICLLLTNNAVYASPPIERHDSNYGVLVDGEGLSGRNYSTYNPNAEIKYESDTYFYINGVERDVSLPEIAEITKKNFNGADSISGFKYNSTAAVDYVEIDDIVDTLVALGYGNEVKKQFQMNEGRLTAVSFNTIRAYDARTGDSDTGKTYMDYKISLKKPQDSDTMDKLNRFLSGISWGDKEAVRKTALYSISGSTEYMPSLTKAPVKATPTPIPSWIPSVTEKPVSPTPASTPLPRVGIHYDGNGAESGSVWDDSAELEGKFRINQNTFRRSGYHDIGYWTTDKAGHGERFYPGESVSLSVRDNKRFLTLYAQWEGNPYVVEYDYNEDFCLHPEKLIKNDEGMMGQKGTLVNVYYSPFEYKTYELSENNRIIHADEQYVLPVPQMEGYNFVNWSFREMESGNGFWGNYCTEETKCRKDENHTLYAVWEKKAIRLEYEFNFEFGIPGREGINAFKGISSNDYENILYGNKYYMLPTPEKEGYKFEGWSLSNDNTKERTITKETVCEIADDHKLYAVWSPVCINLTFEQMNGDDALTKRVCYGDKAETAFFSPHKSGYLFVGWNEREDGSGKFISDSEPLKYITDTHLYAIYEACEYMTKLDYLDYWKREADKPIGFEIKSIKVLNGQKPPELPRPEREGYFFKGWFLCDAEGKKEEQVTSTSIVSTIWQNGLKAQWLPEIVKVIYDYNSEYTSRNEEEEDE